MANLAKFRSMLSAAAETNHGLPEVELKQSTDLGQSFARLVTLDNRHQGETDADLTGRYIDTFCNSLTLPTNKIALELFDQTCSAFAEKVKAAWNSLSGIKEQARELSEEMEALASKFANNDEYVVSNSKYLQLSEDFPVFSWDGTKILGSKNDVARDVNALLITPAENGAAPEPSTALDQRVFNLVVDSLERYTTVATVTLNEETRSALIDQIANVCSETPRSAVEACVDYMSGIRRYIDEYNTLKYINKSPANGVFDAVKKFDSFITVNFPILDAVVSDQVNVGVEAVAQLKVNANAIINFCKIAAYYEMMQRDTVYSDSILLQGGLINSDQQEFFEQNGGNKAMIARHIRMMYRDDATAIPAMGIRSQAILDSDANVTKTVEQDIATIKSRISLTKTNARVSAFSLVAREFIEKREPDPKQRGLAATKKMELFGNRIADAVRQYNINFMDAALDLIISEGYKGTFVELLKNRLGSAYLALVNNSVGEIDNDGIKCAEVGVIADLVCEFVVNKMVNVVSCQELPAVPEGQGEINTTPSEVPVQTPEEVKNEPGAQPAQES